MDLERVRIDTAAALAWTETAWDRTWNPSKLYVAGAIHRKQATDLFCPRSLHIHGQLFFFSFYLLLILPLCSWLQPCRDVHFKWILRTHRRPRHNEAERMGKWDKASFLIKKNFRQPGTRSASFDEQITIVWYRLKSVWNKSYLLVNAAGGWEEDRKRVREGERNRYLFRVLEALKNMVTYLFGSQSLIFLQQLYSQMAYDLYCIPREELNNDE